jgi:hypothetical protein
VGDPFPLRRASILSLHTLFGSYSSILAGRTVRARRPFSGIRLKLFELPFRLFEQFPASLGGGAVTVMLEMAGLI